MRAPPLESLKSQRGCRYAGFSCVFKSCVLGLRRSLAGRRAIDMGGPASPEATKAGNAHAP